MLSSLCTVQCALLAPVVDTVPWLVLLEGGSVVLAVVEPSMKLSEACREGCSILVAWDTPARLSLVMVLVTRIGPIQAESMDKTAPSTNKPSAATRLTNNIETAMLQSIASHNS